MSLYEQLEPYLDGIVKRCLDPANHIKIPDGSEVDADPAEIATLVARTSNVFGMAARMAGIARAQAKLAKGAWERSYKESKEGKSEAERERNAMQASHDLHETMVQCEAIAELASGLEAGARIASESARKLYGSVTDQMKAENRTY